MNRETEKSELEREQVNRFDLLTKLEMQRNGGDRRRAIQAVAKREPEAHQSFLAATQPPTPRFGVPR